MISPESFLVNGRQKNNTAESIVPFARTPRRKSKACIIRVSKPQVFSFVYP